MSEKEEIDLLAAEYVLGTLDPEQAAFVARRAETDTELAAAILYWQESMAPLGALFDEAPEPPGLWQDLVRTLRKHPKDSLAGPTGRWPVSTTAKAATNRKSGALRRIWDSPGLWRAAALVALVAGAAPWIPRELARSPARPLGVATLLAPGDTVPLAIATVAGDGSVELVALRPVSLPPGRSLALWALPYGETSPILLGALAADGGRRTGPVLPNGSTVMVTSEPLSGHRTDTPPGPTLFSGVVATWPVAMR